MRPLPLLLAALSVAAAAGVGSAHDARPARGELDRAVQARPTAALHLERAARRLAAGRLGEALRDCRAAAALEPDDAEPGLCEARCLLATGRIDEASATLAAVRAAWPRNVSGLRLSARLARERDLPEDAVRFSRRALAAAPRAAPDLWLDLAADLRSSGRPDEAAATLDAAVERLGPVPALAEALGRLREADAPLASPPAPAALTPPRGPGEAP